MPCTKSYGLRISTAPTESAVNQPVSRRMVKKQQMRWSREGTHRPLGSSPKAPYVCQPLNLGSPFRMKDPESQIQGMRDSQANR
jgi:hypothetical protein